MKIKALIALLFLAISNASLANVMMEMFEMNRGVNALLRADSTETFQRTADKFLVAAKKAQQTMPASLDDDSERFKGYQQGMQDVIDLVENAKQLAEQGKLTEAKVSVEKLHQLKKLYHSEYK